MGPAERDTDSPGLLGWSAAVVNNPRRHETRGVSSRPGNGASYSR